jgi:hypothetical protein
MSLYMAAVYHYIIIEPTSKNVRTSASKTIHKDVLSKYC